MRLNFPGTIDTEKGLVLFLNTGHFILIVDSQYDEILFQDDFTSCAYVHNVFVQMDLQEALGSIAVLQAKVKSLESKCQGFQKQKERAESDLEETRLRLVMLMFH